MEKMKRREFIQYAKKGRLFFQQREFVIENLGLQIRIIKRIALTDVPALISFLKPIHPLL